MAQIFVDIHTETMPDALRPILELSVVLPGLLLAYIPVKTYLKQTPARLLGWLLPLFAALAVGGGLACWRLHVSTAPAQVVLVLAAIAAYIKTLRISLWKSATVALSVCALFACLNSLSRGLDAAVAVRSRWTEDELWFCLRAGITYNAMCWLVVALAYYPASHVVRKMVEDENFAQTWYVFWILPIIFIALNLFMIPQNRQNLYTGRILQGYIVISLVLLLLLSCFYVIFLWMANSLNRNAKLQLENHFLSLQRERYENLKASIEDARHARHDIRHHFNQISSLLEEGDLEKAKAYVARATGRICDQSNFDTKEYGQCL